MFPNQPDPLADQLRLLSDEVQESDRRKTGLSLTAAIRSILSRLPDAKTLVLVRGAYGLPILESVTLSGDVVINDIVLRDTMGWSDRRSHLWQVSFDTLKDSGLAEEGGPVTVCPLPASSTIGTAIVDIDAFLRIPLGLWYPRRPGEPQLGPTGHRNAVLAAIFPPTVPAPSPAGDALAHA